MGTILRSALIVLAIAAAVSGATTAYFSDSETSHNNTFTAGTLDLAVDGENPLAHAKFAVTNMHPGESTQGIYRLTNTGSIDGYVDIASLTVTSQENGCNEPETTAGDATCGTPGAGEGELAQFVQVQLFEDAGCDGAVSSGDTVFYSGLVKDVPSSFELNTALAAGGALCISARFDWPSTAQDNLAQGDGMQLDLAFELAQTTAQ